MEPKSYLIPNTTNNGIMFGQKSSSLSISEHLNEAAEKSGVIQGNKHLLLLIKCKIDNEFLTLHCFRRGGCQHRFFYMNKAWDLSSIKQWGGWAKNETMDNLINYLLNDYSSR